MADPFIGNKDYRGYLSYLSKNSTDPTIRNPATTLLNLVGNDARFGNEAYFQGSDLYNTNQRLFQQYNDIITPQQPKTLPSIYGGGAAPVYAPKLDTAAINAQARKAAENAVNPYYTKVLNEFLTQQATQRTRAKQQFQTGVKNIEDALKQTLEDNQVSRDRTAEDTARNIGQVNQAADEFQTDSGQQFAEDRVAQARDLAASGLTGGLGAQAKEKTQENRNKTETRQEQKFQEQRDLQERFKTQTFEDLLKSDTRATEDAGKSKAQKQFDLDAYIQNLGFEESNKRNELERSRLEEIQQNSSAQAKQLFNQYLAKITNPAQFAAAVQTYGGLF